MAVRCKFATRDITVLRGIRYCVLTRNVGQCGLECKGLREDKLSCPLWRRH